MQRSSVECSFVRGRSVAKKGAAKLRRGEVLLCRMHRSLGGYNAAQEGSVGCAMACCMAPMKVRLVNVLLPERTINETSAAIINQGGIPGKSYSGIGISSGSQLPQSGIGIPASGSVQYRWPRISPSLSIFN